MALTINESILNQWRWGILAAIVITISTLIPQISLWLSTGSSWQGSYAMLHADEVAYSAYVNALINGRERRNDPYTGRDNRDEAPQAESLFSIQFIPAYLVALPARVFGLSAASSFIWLIILSSFFSTLAIFWLIKSITEDAHLAAAGAIFVLCFGALIATYGELRVYFESYLGQGAGFVAVPFTRRYQPAASFPFFFVFCTLVVYAFNSKQLRTVLVLAVVTGFVLAILIFSYFYLWTAAVAWFLCVSLLFFAFERDIWKRNLILLLTVATISVAAFVPYLTLLSARSTDLDETQALMFTRLPDLFRLCEIVGFLVVSVIVYGIWRKIFFLKNQLILFVLSFALLPLIVFNQQIITGISLQPIHYEIYIVNYVVLISAVITSFLIAQNLLKQKLSHRPLAWVVILALGWGFIEITGLMKRGAALTKVHEESMLIANHLIAVPSSNETNNAIRNNYYAPPTVLAANVDQADILPTLTSQAVLWAPHMQVFSGLKNGENKERFYQFIYFSGLGEKDLAEAISKNNFDVKSALFGYERALPALSANTKSITVDEIRIEINNFSEYKSNFTRSQAAQYNLSYIITYAEGETEFSNLDRWFERDLGEQIGKWKLYRVKLRD